MYPGILSLVDWVGENIMVVTAFGRVITGRLVSFDQFCTVVLDNATEYVFMGKEYAEQAIGSIVIYTHDISMVGKVQPTAQLEGKRDFAEIRQMISALGVDNKADDIFDMM